MKEKTNAILEVILIFVIVGLSIYAIIKACYESAERYNISRNVTIYSEK